MKAFYIFKYHKLNMSIGIYFLIDKYPICPVVNCTFTTACIYVCLFVSIIVRSLALELAVKS